MPGYSQYQRRERETRERDAAKAIALERAHGRHAAKRMANHRRHWSGRPR
jgi:hypothetical protein